ncbi:MAG TPA: HEAT repeat domain-containing protein [Polyangiaceae bacterium]|nr:HEAT repeat domain-containing protein [Polyangiaceae bacterium]
MRTVIQRPALGFAAVVLSVAIIIALVSGLRRTTTQARQSRKPTSSGHSVTTPATPTATPQTRTPEAAFPIGSSQTYAMHETSVVTANTGQAVMQLAFRGPLKLTALRAHPLLIVRAEFSGSVVAGAGSDAQATDSASSEAAHHPFFLEFSEQGLLLDAKGDPAIPAFVARVWVSLGEYLQLSTDVSAKTWERRENDATGWYVAAYEMSSPRSTKKRKLRYESMPSLLSSYNLESSSSEFAMDDAGRLESFRLDERVQVDLAGGPLPSFHAATRLDLLRTAHELEASEVEGWLAALHNATSLRNLGSTSDEAAFDRERIGGRTLGDVFDQLRLARKPHVSKEEQKTIDRAFVALTALLREDPKALATVRHHIEQGGPETNTLLGALRDASTPATQKILAQMSGPDSPLGPAQRMEAARSLSRLPAPTAETVQALKALRADPDVGTQATYGLGSALYRLKGGDPVLAAEARAALVEQLEAAHTEADLSAVLTAFGNAGDAAFVDLVEKRLADPSPAVRAAAAQALRRIPGARADALLARMCGDADANVRGSVIDAIHEREPSAVLAAALAAMVLREPEPDLRASAVTILAHWLSEIPGLAPTLAQVAATDPHPDIRLLAANALGEH